jgi:hypothetical protein
MKKVLLLAGLLALPLAAFAQGTVQFQNTSTTQMTTNSLVANGGTGATGLTTGVNSYWVGLYVAAPGSGSFTLVGTTANQTGLGNGRFNGGTSYPIPGNAGTPIDFQVRAWSQFAGSSYEAAVAASAGGLANVYAGSTTTGNVTPATGGAPSPALFGTGTGQVGGFALNLQPVPEPSSIALGLLGLGAIALFRRRK